MKFDITIENINNTLVTTSNRVADELGVQHRDLLEKIDKYVAKFGSAEVSAGFYIASDYIHPQNKQTYRNYLITEKGIAQLIGGYSSAVPVAFELNIAYINKFEEMKKQIQLMVPTTMSEALKLAYEQQLKIEEMTPKAEYYDKVLSSDNTFPISVIAKEFGFTGTKLNLILNRLGVQWKCGGKWVLYNEYVGKGYAVHKTYHYSEHFKNLTTTHFLYWTEKGREFIYNLLKENDLLD